MIIKRTKNIKERKEKATKIVRDLTKLFPKTKTSLNYSNNWELFVAVVLSAQCTDKKVNEVTKKLFKKYRNLDDYVKASTSKRTKEFEEDIKSTGFYRNKAKNILSAAKIVQRKFSGKMPKTMEEILTIPGVGRKTANVVLGNAYGIVDGIAVDTHVKRLSRLFGLTNNTNPDKIEKDLMEALPKKEWFEFTYRMIDYGRRHCPARPHDRKKCPMYKYEV